MEIVNVSKDCLKIKGKTGSLLIDPSSDMAKTVADAILLLSQKKATVSKVEGYRLVVEGPGEFEVSGVKISAFELANHVSYDIRVDGVEILVTQAEVLQTAADKAKDFHIVVIRTDLPLNQSVITALSPQVVVLYGDKAKEEAKTLGKEITQSVSKYQTTVEKLPAEMEVVVLG